MSDEVGENRTAEFANLRAVLLDQLVDAVRVALGHVLDRVGEAGDSLYAVALLFDPGESPCSLAANTLENLTARRDVGSKSRASFLEVWAAEWSIYAPQPFGAINSMIEDLYGQVREGSSSGSKEDELDSLIESLLVPALETVDVAAIVPPAANGLLIGVQPFPFPEGERAYDLVQRTSHRFSSDFYHQRVVTECKVCLAAEADERRRRDAH